MIRSAAQVEGLTIPDYEEVRSELKAVKKDKD